MPNKYGPPGPPNDDMPPLDDSGINNDHILDVCDWIIFTAWTKYVGAEKTHDQVNVQELKDLAFTLGSVWGLVQDILDIDNRLGGFGGGPDPQDFFDDDEPPF